MRIFIILFVATLFFSTEATAQSDKRFMTSWIPTQWEIYNTKYKRRYWDQRDNYDFVNFQSDHTFTRKYQGISMSGTWSYEKKLKIITLVVAKPFKKTIQLKVKKQSLSKLVYKSSEEGYKVTMYMEKGTPPKRRVK